MFIKTKIQQGSGGEFKIKFVLSFATNDGKLNLLLYLIYNLMPKGCLKFCQWFQMSRT